MVEFSWEYLGKIIKIQSRRLYSLLKSKHIKQDIKTSSQCKIFIDFLFIESLEALVGALWRIAIESQRCLKVERHATVGSKNVSGACKGEGGRSLWKRLGSLDAHP